MVEDIQECPWRRPARSGRHRQRREERVLSALLKKSGVRHVLNAKHHEREASIVGEAGRKGAVTVATNMAGRGTDIMLGGNPEMRAAADLEARGLDPWRVRRTTRPPPGRTPQSKAEESVKAEHEEVTSLGPVRAGHRAPRVPPYRQPVAGPVGTSG